MEPIGLENSKDIKVNASIKEKLVRLTIATKQLAYKLTSVILCLRAVFCLSRSKNLTMLLRSFQVAQSKLRQF